MVKKITSIGESMDNKSVVTFDNNEYENKSNLTTAAARITHKSQSLVNKKIQGPRSSIPQNPIATNPSSSGPEVSDENKISGS